MGSSVALYEECDAHDGAKRFAYVAAEFWGEETRHDQRSTEGAHVAQLAEHVLGKDEVTRSIRVVGSMHQSVSGA